MGALHNLGSIGLGMLLCAALAACGDDENAGRDAAQGQRDAGSTPRDSGLDASAPFDAGAPLVDAALDAGGGSGDGGSGNPPMDGGGTPGGDGGGPFHDAGSTGDASTPPPMCDASKAPALTKLKLTQVVSGLSNLVYAAQPKGSSDWYLVEQTGKIKVFTSGALRTAAFLDLSSQTSPVGSGDERGLLGLAFHPDYGSTGKPGSGKLYVMLTPIGSEQDTVLQYTRSASDPYKAENPVEIVKLESSAGNHNGGTVMFGPDGKLYVGTGDGGGTCNNNKTDKPQDVSSLFGKILRLDVSKAAPYAADGNPFATGGDARVLHYGLRNPFRFGFDRATGDLYIGDVGQDTYEEVNVALAESSGLNFGWGKYEGNDSTCPGRELRQGSTHTPPIYTDQHIADEPNSVVGGFVYRGAAIPKLQGAYVFSDYYGGTVVTTLYHCAGTTSPLTTLLKECDLNNPSAPCFDSGPAENMSIISAIVEGSDAEMYFVANNKSLYKVVPN